MMRYWGEIPGPAGAPPSRSSFDLLQREFRSVEMQDPPLHQPSAQRPRPTTMLDIPSEPCSLTIHTVQLCQHTRRLRSLLAAAQGKGLVPSEGGGPGGSSRLEEGEALPPRPPTPPAAPDDLLPLDSKAPWQPFQLCHSDPESDFYMGKGEPVTELSWPSCRQLLYQSVATVLAHAGFESAQESVLETLTDLAHEHYLRLSRLLRTAVDREARLGATPFPDVVEQVFHEVGIGSVLALQRFWQVRIKDYHSHMLQVSKELSEEYERLVNPEKALEDSKPPRIKEEPMNDISFPVSEEPAPTRKMAPPLMEKLSESLGSPEPAVRLILSVLVGYPCALLYRQFFFHQPPTVIHLYHAISGLSLAAFNFGTQLYHSALCVLVQFLMMRLMGRTITTVLASFMFQMAYLLSGYYYTATEEYDIKWTMPQCVLALKLIGLSFDYYDGGQEPSKLNEEQKRSALANVPSLLEVIGFSYFYGGFLVGPQFTLRSYQRLVKGELTDCPGQPPNSVIPAMKRFSLGLLCLVIYAIFSPHYPDSYYLTDEYDAQPFWYRCVFILLWAKVILYKYVSCWVIAEGVCILSGLGYNGLGQNGEHQWDACANMKVWTFETTPLFTGTIASFNINTNAWVARHVFKRLKFLGNKLLSQVTALAFLAIWHGTHSGYLLCFSMEFIIVNVERQAQALVRDSPLLTRLANSPLYPLIYLVQQFIHWLFMGYPLVPFCLFTYDKWLRVYSSIYFCGHIFFFALYLGIPYLRKVLVPRKERSEKKED